MDVQLVLVEMIFCAIHLVQNVVFNWLLFSSPGRLANISISYLANSWALGLGACSKELVTPVTSVGFHDLLQPLSRYHCSIDLMSPNLRKIILVEEASCRLTDVDDVEVVHVGEVELGVVGREAEDLLGVPVARRRRSPHAQQQVGRRRRLRRRRRHHRRCRGDQRQHRIGHHLRLLLPRVAARCFGFDKGPSIYDVCKISGFLDPLPLPCPHLSDLA